MAKKGRHQASSQPSASRSKGSAAPAPNAPDRPGESTRPPGQIDPGLVRWPVEIMVLGLLIYLWFSPILELGEQSWASHSPSYDVMRAIATIDAWAGGLWDARWFALFDAGFGYPFLSFYAPLFSWTTALFGLMFGSPVVGQTVNLILWLIAGTVGMHMAANRFWSHLSGGRRDWLPGFIAAIGWLISPYILVNVHVRGDGPEFLSMQMLPWILYAAFGVLLRCEGWSRADWRDLFVASLAMAVAILAHNFLAMVAVGLALVIVLLAGLLRLGLPSIRQVRSSWFTVRVGAWAGAIAWALLATMFFWLPALADGEYVRIHVVAQGYSHYTNHFLYWSNLANVSFWGTGPSWAPPRQDEMPLHLGFVSVLAVISVLLAAILAFYMRRWRLLAGIVSTAIFTWIGLAMTMSISRPIWDRVEIMQMGQFPWRLLCVPTVGLCLLLPAALVALRLLLQDVVPQVQLNRNQPPREIRLLGSAHQIGRLVALTGMGLALLLTFVLSHSFYVQSLRLDPWAHVNLNPAMWSQIPMWTANEDEYGPIWRKTLRKSPYPPGEIVAGPGITYDGENQRYRLNLRVRNSATTPGALVIGYNYYPAWKVRSEPPNDAITLSPAPETGHIAVSNIPPGQTTIQVYFGNTPARATGKAVAAGAWLLWLGGLGVFSLRGRIAANRSAPGASPKQTARQATS